ncbi:MAG: trypsin-like peptidase domain-containing protein, partial [Bacteroidota bacterium]|nr:trypsin-like peptidase domain-containing protein [Bacteroidota bacterium]
MKKFVRFFLASVMGGAMTLLAYTQWLQPKKQIQNNLDIITPTLLPVDYSSRLSGGNNADFTAAAEKTLHAVVHVKNTTISQGYTSFEDLFFGRSRGRTQVGTGSGVIISSDGYIVTNNHVIQGAQSIEVTTNNNKTYNAELIGSDPTTDIALLKIQTNESLNYTQFVDSNTTKIGEWVLAVGN